MRIGPFSIFPYSYEIVGVESKSNSKAKSKKGAPKVKKAAIGLSEPSTSTKRIVKVRKKIATSSAVKKKDKKKAVSERTVQKIPVKTVLKKAKNTIPQNPR